jgi:hypothetical protein
MTHLAVWLAVCVIISAVGVLRPSAPLTCSLALLAFLPESAAQILTDIPLQGSSGVLSVHPATWLLLVAVPLQFCAAPHRFFSLSLRRGGSALLALAVFISVAALSTIASRGTSGFSQLLESIVGPIFLFLLVHIVWNHAPVRWSATLNMLQLYGLLVAVLAIVQNFAKRDLVFESYYQTERLLQSFAPGEYRSTAFLGHPLVVAMFLVAMLPLMRRPGFRGRTPGVLGTLLLIGGIAATGSRSGLVIGGAYVLLGSPLLRNGGRIGHRVGAFIATPVGLVAVLFATPIGATVLTRLTTHDASIGIRQDAANVFLHNWTHFVAYGSGIGASFAVSAEGLGATHSFENPAMMLAVDAGLFATLCFYYALLTLAVQRRHAWRALESHAFLLALFFSFGFSSYGTKSVAGYLLWLFAAIASTMARAGRIEADRSACVSRTVDADLAFSGAGRTPRPRRVLTT